VEIGAGPEAGGWFLKVGSAARPIAKGSPSLPAAGRLKS